MSGTMFGEDYFSILLLHLLVAHRVARNVVADHVLRVPRLAVHALNLNAELREIEQREIRFEFLSKLRKATIGDCLRHLCVCQK